MQLYDYYLGLHCIIYGKHNLEHLFQIANCFVTNGELLMLRFCQDWFLFIAWRRCRVLE